MFKRNLFIIVFSCVNIAWNKTSRNPFTILHGKKPKIAKNILFYVWKGGVIPSITVASTKGKKKNHSWYISHICESEERLLRIARNGVHIWNMTRYLQNHTKNVHPFIVHLRISFFTTSTYGLYSVEEVWKLMKIIFVIVSITWEVFHRLMIEKIKWVRKIMHHGIDYDVLFDTIGYCFCCMLPVALYLK